MVSQRSSQRSRIARANALIRDSTASGRTIARYTGMGKSQINEIKYGDSSISARNAEKVIERLSGKEGGIPVPTAEGVQSVHPSGSTGYDNALHNLGRFTRAAAVLQDPTASRDAKRSARQTMTELDGTTIRTNQGKVKLKTDQDTIERFNDVRARKSEIREFWRREAS